MTAPIPPLRKGFHMHSLNPENPKTTWTYAMYPTAKQRRKENIALGVLVALCVAGIVVIGRV